MNRQLNPFLDALPDLGQLREAIWEELEQSASQPDKPWGLGTFTTVSHADESHLNSPRVRMLVLRRVDKQSRSLTWHTDRRSAKIEELKRNSHASVLFWSSEVRVQLVVHGLTSLYTSGRLFEQEWNASQLTSRRAYLGDSAPGTTMGSMCVNFPDQFQSSPPSETESQKGRENFAVMETIISEMDLLILRKSGNVRTRSVWDECRLAWDSTWVCP